MSSSSTILSSILIIIFFVSNNVIVDSTPLIDQACSDDHILVPEKPLCLHLLNSQPKIVSATTPLNIFVAIMNSGASSETATLKHVESLLEKSTSPDVKAALQECQKSFKWSKQTFINVLSEVKDDKEYQTATYDLLIAATDAIQPCKDSIASKRINDDVIANGLREARLYGFSGFQVVTVLEGSS